MRYFYDTEFLEDGRTIELISIGIVAEDGREYYAVNSEAPWKRISAHDWLCKNVVPQLPLADRDSVQRQLDRAAQESKPFYRWEYDGDVRQHLLDFTVDGTNTRVKPKWVIANEVRDFLLDDDALRTEDRELWAYYAAYDHVALAQLWGPMVTMPHGIPFYTNDLRSEMRRLGVTSKDVPKQEGDEHNALADARQDAKLFAFLSRQEGW